MNSIQFKINEPCYRNKMFAIDFDHTMVTPQNCRKFPKNVDDWEWFDTSVPGKIKEYYDDGYMIVIFTNQSKKWKQEQIEVVAKALGVPVFVVIATEKKDYKPNINLFKNFVLEKTIDLEHSIFVGDALGRKNDFSDSDKMFAENIGIKYIAPEQIFMDTTNTKTNENETNTLHILELKLPNIQQLIIMVGYPGSGKTTIARSICDRYKNYIHIYGDICKTVSKTKKAMKEVIKQSKSMVIDATNSSSKKRKEYIDIAKQNGYVVVCIHMTTTMRKSYNRNLKRPDDEKIPLVAYHVFNKYFDSPDENEGFKLVSL